MRGLKTLLRGGKYYRIYLFLFNDLLLVTKMKGYVQFFVSHNNEESFYEKLECLAQELKIFLSRYCQDVKAQMFY